MTAINRLFLIGYMGVGKTTLGLLLAQNMNLQFIDLDLFIETRYQKTIGQLFEESGESKFREIESLVLREVTDFENVIISTGGGTPCFFDNMDYMNSKGTTIYLKSSPEALAKRLYKGKNKRPLIKDKNEKELLAFIKENMSKRDAFYSKAHITFEVENCNNKEEIENITPELIQAIKRQ